MPFQHSQNYKSPNTGVAGDRTNSLNQQLSWNIDVKDGYFDEAWLKNKINWYNLYWFGPTMLSDDVSIGMAQPAG
jgi:hypothetical protein